MTTNKKKRISNAQFKELLIKELAKPETKAHIKTNFYELLQTEYSINKQRALKLHDLHYSELVSERNGKLAGKTIEMEIEALKANLSDKNERNDFGT